MVGTSVCLASTQHPRARTGDQARPQAKPANPVVDPQVVDNTECPAGLLRPLTALMSHEYEYLQRY